MMGHAVLAHVMTWEVSPALHFPDLNQLEAGIDWRIGGTFYTNAYEGWQDSGEVYLGLSRSLEWRYWLGIAWQLVSVVRPSERHFSWGFHGLRIEKSLTGSPLVSMDLLGATVYLGRFFWQSNRYYVGVGGLASLVPAGGIPGWDGVFLSLRIETGFPTSG